MILSPKLAFSATRIVKFFGGVINLGALSLKSCMQIGKSLTTALGGYP